MKISILNASIGARTCIFFVFSACLLLIRPVAAADVKTQAAAILKSIDRPVGLVHLPRCGSGKLAAALMDADADLRIHGQDADLPDVQEARKTAHDKGWHGRRAWFDHGGLNRLLPVANSCDLLIMSDVTAEDLSSELASEISRVLHPWYGVALLGGDVPDDTLLQWSRQCGSGVQAVSPLVALGSHRFLRLEKAALEGADNWGHFWHGPDNNAVSHDTAYSYPETIQWTGKPFRASRTDLPIVANGRLFMLWNSNYLAYTPKGEAVLPGEQAVIIKRGAREKWRKDQRGPLLVARATGSGAFLWHRRLSSAAWLQAGRSIMVVEGDHLLVADGGVLLEMDPATGAERRRVELDCDEIKWVAAKDDYVVVLGGAAFKEKEDDEWMKYLVDEPDVRFRSAGSLLTVLDRTTLQPLWSEERAQEPYFDPRTLAVSGGRVFVFAEDSLAQALDLPTVALLWKTETGIEFDHKVGHVWHRSFRHPVAGYALGGLYIVGSPKMDRCAVLNQEDGRAMWDLERGRMPWAPVPLGYRDLIWFNGSGVEPATGEVRENLPLSIGGCGHITAAPRGFVNMVGLTWDIIDERSIPPVRAKSACANGQFVANGLIWRIPSGVGHVSEFGGFNVRGPAETDLPPNGPRLVQGHELRKPGAETAGWTNYRGNVQRTGSTSARVGGNVDVTWKTSFSAQSVLEVPGGVLVGARIVPVPPVTGGNTVVAASNDGTVLALDLETGAPLWRALTGGRIQSSPAIWRDRVFVGSADGCVYAFALDDGRLLWRLRVAPEQGRMMFFEQLGSRWPVLASPLVVDGRLYAVAGYMDRLDGLWAVAADAATGELIWERTDWRGPDGETLSPTGLLGGAGRLCWDPEHRELLYSAGEGVPLRIAPADGTPRSAYARDQYQDDPDEDWVRRDLNGAHYTAGSDIGIFAFNWILMGGGSMLNDKPLSTVRHKYDIFFQQKPNGDGRFPLRRTSFNLMPAWDDGDALFAYGRNSIALLAKERVLHTLQESEGMEIKRIRPWLLRMAPVTAASLHRWHIELDRFETPLASALTANAALVVIHKDGRTKSPDEHRLVACDRSDGKPLWQVTLPSRPVLDGLAVAHDGTVVLTCRNGEIMCISSTKGADHAR